MEYSATDTMIFIIYLLVIGLFYFAKAVIFGYICQHIISSKGYDKNWFWLGFFFGIIPLIVALVYPKAPDNFYQMYGNQPIIHEEWYRKQERERYEAQMEQYRMQCNEQYRMQCNEQNKIQYDEQYKESEVNS